MNNTNTTNETKKPATLLVPRYDRDGNFSAMDLYEVDGTSGKSRNGIAVEYVEVEMIDQGVRSTRKITLLEYVQGVVNGHMKTFHDGNRIKWEGTDHAGTYIAGRTSWTTWKETLTVYILDSSIIVKATRVASLPYDHSNPVLCRMFNSILESKIEGWNAFGENDRKRSAYQARLDSCSQAIKPVLAAGGN